MFLLACFFTLVFCEEARFSSAHLVVERGAPGGGVSSLLAEWSSQTHNATALLFASPGLPGLFRLNLANSVVTPVTRLNDTMRHGQLPLAWRSHVRSQQALTAGNSELLFGSSSSAQVFGRSSSDAHGVKLRDYTAATTGWGAVPLPDVSALAVGTCDDKMYAATCGDDDALYFYDDHRGLFCKIADGYGCLGTTLAFADDQTMFAVSMKKRQVVAVTSGYAKVIAQLPFDVIPRSVALDSRQRLYVGANRVTRNARQAEVHHVDIASGNLTLVGAVGGAQLHTLVVTHDDRVFFTDEAHHAIHEIEFRMLGRQNQLKLIHEGFLVSGAKHEGGASAVAESWGHAAFRTHMLIGTELPSIGGGIAAYTTPNYETNVVLAADAFQLKSITAERFVDTWPLGAVPKEVRLVGARNVYVAPARLPEPQADRFENRTVFTTDWVNGEAFLLTAFAPHRGDFSVRQHFPDLGQPYGIASANDYAVLVADFAGNRLVDANVGNRVITDQLQGPVCVALADDAAEHLYVTEYLSGQLVRVTRATGDIEVIAANLTQPEGCAVSPLDGFVTVVETGGLRRVLNIDPASGNMTEIDVKVATGGDSTPTHPGRMAGVSWSDRIKIDKDVEQGARYTASLYVSLDGSGDIVRYVSTWRDADACAKPTDAALYQDPRPVVESDGRRVLTISLFHHDMPPAFAVPAGTWLRIKAFRHNELNPGGFEGPYVLPTINERMIQSDDIPNFPSALLFPRDSGAQPTQMEVLLEACGQFSFYDARAPETARRGSVFVYDAAYDNPNSYKFMVDPTPAPTQAPEPEEPCRTEILCALGYRGFGEKDARGCYIGELRCNPVAKTKLGVLQQDRADGSPGNVHGGPGPYVWGGDLEYVLGGFHPIFSDIQKPTFPGSIYEWKKWREWWQRARPGAVSPSQYWYAPQFRRGLPTEEVDNQIC